ncbi:hypothetical protein CTAYLR_001236 [Chrysophaeum taylorii]|uniref:CRAL-TRIO domain-containing protein n=1 Tax=Chrysophaeum taylorii TaxID=2483200 RepID=A0AAD7UEL4_9STRA|nr:hypothetical protein CTAYLR_001236 [Chrysophaeum taylorii]
MELLEARWLGEEKKVSDTPASSAQQRINARIERYATNNGGAPLYFVRAEAGNIERTLSLKFDQFRQLHRRLAEEGGVLYATAPSFPKPLRKARLGLRLTPSEIGEQCEGLNAWLRDTTASIEQLPLALQREVRQFLALEGTAPPAWTTAKASSGLFAGAMATGRQRAKKREAVYPLGESVNLPGVTRRGRLECRDRNSGQWLSTHVILTHLSLLVFQPLDEAARAKQRGATEQTAASASDQRSSEAAAAVATSERSAAESVAAQVGAPGAHPFAAALAEGVNGGPAASDPAGIIAAAAAAQQQAAGPASGDAASKAASAGTPRPSSTSQGRLLHNLHVTDVLSILRHGDNESMSAPPIHHRCFSITDLNDASVCLRAVNARDCLQWLKAIARAKDRALAAVHRLDDKSHGHELVLATLKRSSEASPLEPPFDERIVARGKPGMAYGWFEPLRVDVVDATLRFELNAGVMEVRVGSLLERSAADAAAGLGAATSAAAAEAAASGAARAAFWAKVTSDDKEWDQRTERLEVLVAVDATAALAAGEKWRDAQLARDSQLATRALRGLHRVAARHARRLFFVCFKNDYKVAAAVAAAVLSALFALVTTGDPVAWRDPRRPVRFEVGGAGQRPSPSSDRRHLVLLVVGALSSVQEDAVSETGAAVVASASLRFAAFLGVVALAAAAVAVVCSACPEDVDNDDEELAAYSRPVADAFRAARRSRLAVDVRLVNWRWRDADRELRDRGALPAYYRPTGGIRRPEGPKPPAVNHHKEPATVLQVVSPTSVRQTSGDATPGGGTGGAEDDEPSAPKPLPLDVPARFLGAVRGDPVAAAKRWAETVAFRDAGNDPHLVLQRPQPHFHKIKARHKHFVHKRDKRGHIVAFEVVEAPNRAFKELGNEGITVEDVVNHMHFVSAFTYVKILDDVDYVGVKPKDPEGYFLKIIDLRQIGLADCGGDTARYFRLVSGVNRHYPERVWKTLIINAPSVFGVIWTIVSPLLEPNVREKITVLRKDYKDTLRDLVDPDSLPVEYGGNDPDTSPEERALAAFADDLTKAAAAAAAATTDDEAAAANSPPSMAPPSPGLGAERKFLCLDEDNAEAAATTSSAPPLEPLASRDSTLASADSSSATSATPSKPVAEVHSSDDLEHI